MVNSANLRSKKNALAKVLLSLPKLETLPAYDRERASIRFVFRCGSAGSAHAHSYPNPHFVSAKTVQFGLWGDG
jgi:hypothetical protein